MKSVGGVFRVLLVLAVCFLFASPLAAQVATGTFTGFVTDPSGAAIANAKVTVTNEGTNVSVSRQTNVDGLYTIPDLLPGFYTLKAEAQGFKTLVNTHVELTVGYTQRVNFKLDVGALSQVVTVEGQAPLVDTETNRMSELVTAAQVQNLPLNGRNIFELVQLAPGAVNVGGLITEPGNRGFTTVVNGARVNMNGYYIDGVPDKGLSGGSNTQPSVDTVQEVRVDTEVISAEYGSTVGALTQIALKSGTNDFHGTAYEFIRNDKLDARGFFETAKNPFRMNQFGATTGGPIKKNKLFFFASYEGERTRAAASELLSIETPQFRQLVIDNSPTTGPQAVAALLYSKFPGPAPTSGTCDKNVRGNSSTGICSLQDYITVQSGFCATFDAACISSYGLNPNSGLGAALLANPNLPTFGNVNAPVGQRNLDSFHFYNGNQFSGRVDYQGSKDRVFGRYFFDRFTDPTYAPGVNGGNPSAAVGVRNFRSPITQSYPQVALSWVRTISPTVVNEMRAGWNQGITDVAADNPGVPQITIDPGEVQFGNYNGYPQIFHEEVFHFADLVSINRGKHYFKFGGNIQRNYENSEFNVGRPSYEFFDSVSLAAALVEAEVAGTEPGIVDLTTGQSLGGGHLASNIRGWRNWEVGVFVNDTWKVTPHLTLTLGLRWDLYTSHRDKYGHATQFVVPDIAGATLTQRMRAVNCYENVTGGIGFDGQPCRGGFAPKLDGNLVPPDHNNFGPRVGFAWDIFGNGKTALRGGFGMSYQGEIYNPLSNSRWNPPYYSFNLSFCSTGTATGGPGPGTSDSCIFGPPAGVQPSFTGSPSNLGAGSAAATLGAFAGNIQGWNPWNSNAAFLTGLVFKDFRTPYVYGNHLSLEHEFPGGFVLKTSWVGTFGHKLYRAEDINRAFGNRDANGGAGGGVGNPNFGICGAAGIGAYRVNCLFGRMRTWQNSVNSNYHAIQVVLDKRMTHGLEFHTNYVWSHSLDTRSTWHSGATTSNGAAEGFSMDQAKPNLDYGNSIFDVRHRFTTSVVWELPWLKSQQGAAGHILGGWQINGAVTVRGGFPWTPYCNPSSFPGGASSCDFNGDGVRNDRPNVPAFGVHNNSDREAFEAGHPNLNLTIAMFRACSVSPNRTCANFPGPYNGSLGRNTFRGPNFREVDLSFFKNIKTTERVSFQFRAEAFNLLNRTNLQMPIANFNGSNSSLFGLSTQAYLPRQIQFGLKMKF